MSDKVKDDGASTEQGAPTDKAHQDAGDGTLTGSVPAGLTADELQKQAEQLTDVVEHAMMAAGHEHGRDRATTLIAAIDGVLLRALREEPPRREQFVESSMRLLLGQLVGLGRSTGGHAADFGVS